MSSIGKGGNVYIMSNKYRTVLYIGVTGDLNTRVIEHKSGNGSAFTKKYNCTDILYYEFYDSIEDAIHREKCLKKYKRKWKENLIRKFNPDMKDLFDKIHDLR
ncbi:MAG: GIY-YIG nuclease family protein [Bacteroidetes bacterium]|nr:GIY-YIG nuclease family protein [Bacteroidota bacterium]